MDDDFSRTGQDVVREVLAALAPGELPYVEPVLRAYRIRPWVPADDLPAGLPGIWTPFVLGFVTAAVVTPAGAAATRPVAAGRRGFAALLDRWRRPRHAHLAWVPDLPVPAFDHEQLRAVWAAATDAATGHGCSLRDREAFAAAVVAALSAGPVPRPGW